MDFELGLIPLFAISVKESAGKDDNRPHLVGMPVHNDVEEDL